MCVTWRCCHHRHHLWRRYATLGEPCQIRRDNLQDALLLYQFYRDVQDEVRWIDEKTPIAASRDLGDNLTTRKGSGRREPGRVK